MNTSSSSSWGDQSQAATAGPSPKSLTQTRKNVNALLVDDYTRVNEELKAKVVEVRDLVKAKEDLEVMALVSGIALPAIPLPC